MVRPGWQHGNMGYSFVACCEGFDGKTLNEGFEPEIYQMVMKPFS